MKRLSVQKQLRRQGIPEDNAVEKIESPLMKVDANGNISCVICRTHLKSASIWKVHVNTKAHKNNVQVAKELKSKILSTQIIQTEAIQKNVTPKNPIKTKPIDIISIKQIAVKEIDTKNVPNADRMPLDPLPLAFFDSSAAETGAKNSMQNKDSEWELFQKEIKEVSVAPNEIFSTDQKYLAAEKEITEIDEQIQHWSKVLDLEEKRKNLNHKVIGKKKTSQQHDQSDEEPSEGDDFQEYTDWRSKVFK